MNIRVIAMDNLMEEAFHPSLIHDYCSRCENYNMHFACPQHDFSLTAYLSLYSHVMIISHRLEVKQDEYYYWRDLIDPLLISYERKFSGEALLAGSCRNCDFCFDKGGSSCFAPDLLRYSLESLGFDVRKILKLYFREELSFSAGSLQLVYAMLLKSSPDPIVLKNFEGELNGLSY